MFSTLLIGAWGSGKTTAACTAHGPVGVIDFDNKLHKMVNLSEKLTKGEVVQIPIDEPLSKVGLRKMSTDKYDMGGNRIFERPTGYLKFVDNVEELEKTGCVWKGIKLATLVLDSYTTMIEHLKRLLLQSNGKMTMTMPLYGCLLSNLEEVNSTLLRLPCNVIIICHQRLTKDELSGNIHYEPMIEGQMASKIGKDFEEVYYMEKKIMQGKAEFKMLTVGDTLRACRTSRVLPAEVEPNFVKLYGDGNAKKV